jgi:hypothetical protein
MIALLKRPIARISALGLAAIALLAGAALSLITIQTLTHSDQATALEPRIAFYRDDALLLADLSGSNAIEIAPARLQPSYGGWHSVDGDIALFYTAVDRGEVTLHRRSLASNSDDIIARIAAFQAPADLSPAEVANAPTIRVSPSGQTAIVATPETLHLVDLLGGTSSEITIADPLASFLGFRIVDWSPDGRYVLVHATRANGSGGSNLIMDTTIRAVAGQVPGLHAAWSPAGKQVCGGVAGPEGVAIPRIWIASGPSWQVREGLPGAVIPAVSCDWLDENRLIVATESWPLLEGENSPLPTVMAEIFGATDKANPQETMISLGKVPYILPAVSVVALEAGRIEATLQLKPEIEPGATVPESEFLTPLAPRVIAVPSRRVAIVSVKGERPAIIGIGEGSVPAALQAGDEVVDVIDQ